MIDFEKVIIYDLESDGLLDTISKLHVLSIGFRSNGKWVIKSTRDEKDIEKLFSNPDNILVGHNIICYDIPAIRILYPHIEIKCQFIDTLGLSWYLYNHKLKHGLEEWGNSFGTEETVKKKIESWTDLTFEEYKERCESDIRINVNVWLTFYKLLKELYDTDEEIWQTIQYSNHKLNCLRIQEENPILINIAQCQKNLDELQEIIDVKAKELVSVMPKVPVKALRKFPKKGLYKVDGSLSVAGEKWMLMVQSCGLSTDYQGDIQVITEYKEPNPQSNDQVKDLLFSHGWEPLLFKDGANGKVPQLRDDEKNLCKSILKLIETVPALSALEGMSVAQHRAGYLKAFLSMADENGYISASANGFARSWRLKHRKPFVNLPKPSAQHGKYIRSVMIAPEGKVLIGSDLSSLEDKTKQISIYSYDKEYVEQMNFPGFDAHLDIGLRAELMTQDQVDFFRWFKKRNGDAPEVFQGLTDEQLHHEFETVSKRRAVAKTVNYAATYAAGPAKIAESARIPLTEAKTVVNAYWERNWAVKKYADDRDTKVADGRTWIYNPYSKLWLELKSSHIRFSSVNQNFGARVFDIWMFFCLKYGLLPIFQAHDELLLCVDDDPATIEATKKKLQRAIDMVNKTYDHPIKFEIDIQVGKTYEEVH